MSDELKAKGNAAFSAGDYTQATAFFSDAICIDPSNQVLFSNRSAANAAIKNFDSALQDAEEAIRLAPQWPKGYGRKGAALHGLGRYEEAEAAYNKGLEIEPTSAILKKGLQEVKGASPASMMNPFASEEAMGRLITDSATRTYFSQPDFMNKLNEIRQNPSALSKHMQDQRIMKAMFVAMGLNASFSSPKTSSEEIKEETKMASENSLDSKQADFVKASEPENLITKDRVNEKEVERLKNCGNEEFKMKNFEEALSFYDDALAINPNAIAIELNKTAVYFEQCRWDECIKLCLEVVDRGRELRADFKLIARAFGRVGSAYLKQGRLEDSVVYFNKSLAEHRSPEILEKLRSTEKEIAAAKKAACHSPELSEKERELGNELFKKGAFVEALKHYSEAIIRNDKDPRAYSNRAACYTKLASFTEAIRDCDKAIELDPAFIKAYLRKASIYFGLKEFQKSLDACFDAKAQDSEGRHSAEIEQLLAKCYLESQRASANESAEQTLQRAMADPEIKGIMTDPVMQSILQQMQSDPKAIQDHMKNPGVANKIKKLMAAGIIRAG